MGRKLALLQAEKVTDTGIPTLRSVIGGKPARAGGQTLPILWRKKAIEQAGGVRGDKAVDPVGRQQREMLFAAETAWGRAQAEQGHENFITQPDANAVKEAAREVTGERTGAGRAVGDAQQQSSRPMG